MSDDLDIQQRLRLAADLMVRRSRMAAFGDSSSEVDQANRAAATERVPRTDLHKVEITEHLTLCLRDLFAQHPTFTWVGNGQGRTDVRKSDIVIEHVFASPLTDVDLEKPYIKLRPGPSTRTQTNIGYVKHWDLRTGNKTRTGLDVGSMQILVHCKTPALAEALAEFIVNFMTANEDEIRHQRIHEIQNITAGGYEDGNPLYNRGTGEKTHALIPVTFTYFYQWTLRTRHRPGTFEMGTAAVLGEATGDFTGDEDPARTGGRPPVGEPIELKFASPFDEET